MVNWIKSLDFSQLAFILGIILYILIILYTIVKIIKDTESPSKALGYLLLVLALPIVGCILYFSIGVNYRLEKLYKRKYTKNKTYYNNTKKIILKNTEQRIKDHAKLLEGKTLPIRMLLKDSLSALYTAEKTELLINGENKFEVVLSELKKAKHHIHIQYYIFSDDKIGNKIKDILIKKAQEGVVVRFIFDDFGSHELRKRMYKELINGGVLVAAFYQIKLYALANRMNYRNHRKIIIIDSETGFLGGINVNDKYINTPDNTLYWRDTHLMIKGEAVNGLQFTFLNDWNFCSKNKVDIYDTQYFHPVSSEKESHNYELLQIASSGPDSDRATIMLAYNGVIMSSKERLYLTTPYLIPSETIVNALKYSALSGVDVRLLVPYKSDSIIVNAASCAYYEELLAAGVRIYRYTKGFVHAKTIVSDNNLSVVGSANIDMRSFDLNFEISALLYSKTTNQQLSDAFMEDIKNSIELDYKEWKNRNKFIKFGNSIAKLVSPLL